MTRSRHKHDPRDRARGRTPARASVGEERAGDEQGGGGRHLAAVATLEAAIAPVLDDLGYELLLLEWLGAGKRRLLRLYIDSPAGVTIEDCTRLGRILSNALDAREAAAGDAAGDAVDAGSDADPEIEAEPAPEPEPERDPVLAALLSQPYTLEISSPGVDRPLTRRRHFAAQVGAKVKIETWAPLVPGEDRKKFSGKLLAVEDDPEAPEDQRRGTVIVHDPEGDRTLRFPLPRIRRANLVWEG